MSVRTTVVIDVEGNHMIIRWVYENCSGVVHV